MPEKRNSLGYEMLLQLEMAAKEMELDDEIKVIIKGDGSCFSSGCDITPGPEKMVSLTRPADGYIHPVRDPIW